MDIPSTCPGLTELDELSVELSRSGVAVEVIGHSRGGRPIRCISPASGGTLNALVVGTPHPNEPIGGRTIQVIVKMLLRNPRALAALPFRWHFIPTIEPDGLALNDSWLGAPHDVGAYFRGFYRPAFRHQAEYAFPLRTKSYRFDAVTPETQAWMSAIDKLQPALMVSLHNADHGGAFNVLSRAHPELANALSQQAGAHGIALDEAGDPFWEQRVLAPGVFLADDFCALVEQAPGAWTAGDSSFGYASRYGTLGLVPEVPLWQEDAAQTTPATSDAWPRTEEVYEATVALVERALAVRGPGTEPDLMLDATIEGAQTLRRLLATQKRKRSAPVPGTLANLARRRLRMLPLRTLGMLGRWCGARGAGTPGAEERQALASIERQAADLMHRQLGDESLTSGVVPVPLHAAVATQLQAILSAAAVVAAERGLASSMGPSDR
jgi:hypothetical protein